MTALALGLPALVCYVGVSLLGVRGSRPLLDVVLKASLALPLGCGLSASLSVLWLLLVGHSPATFRLVETIGLIAGAALMLWWRGRRRRAQPPEESRTAGPGDAALLLCALGLVVLLASGVFVAISARMPHGGTDAWTTWNLHARLLVRAGDAWAESLARLPASSHPDYPLLVPASVAKIWSMQGTESVAAPILVAGVFTFSTLMVLVCTLARLRGIAHGVCAGFVLLAIPGFLVTGAAQIADIPLAFFILATVALLCLHDACPERSRGLLWLSGATAGLAACTKNEGLLFLLAVIAARLWAVTLSRGWRLGLNEGAWLLSGAALFATLAIGAKLEIGAGSNLLHGDGQFLMARLADGSRIAAILQAFPQELYGLLGVRGIVIAACVLALGITPPEQLRCGLRTGLAVLALMLGGYAIVYWISPYDLTSPDDLVWYIQASLQRLYAQILPVAVLMACLAAGPSGTEGKKDHGAPAK